MKWIRATCQPSSTVGYPMDAAQYWRDHGAQVGTNLENGLRPTIRYYK